jgi:hypothetical protein
MNVKAINEMVRPVELNPALSRRSGGQVNKRLYPAVTSVQ